ncbi:MAG: DUF721 domain-containing protein [Acidobacteria bacterium]|nr:DUF721 domain-containing protein [Acidobacteriota bacterium]
MTALRRVARPEKPLDLLAAVWPLMVGRRLALHTRPVAWSKGRMDVAVDQPEWHSQLESMSKDVRAQVNRWWGSELVREVRFVAERSKRQAPSVAGKSNAGGLKTRPYGRSDAGGTPSEESALRAAVKELEPTLKGIADSDLRELIARVAGQYLGRQGKS